MEGGRKYYDWTCWRCSFTNHEGRYYCCKCDAYYLRPKDWQCSQCRATVFGSKEACRCGEKNANARPDTRVKKSDDWSCPQCCYSVFGSKSTCPRCGSGPARSNAPTRQSDWLCTTCNFTVFGSKPSCKKCGMARPCLAPQKERECPICLEAAEKMSVLLPCGHLFCNGCVGKLDVCPICRAEVTQTNPVFL